LVAALVAVAAWQGGPHGREALLYGPPALALASMCVARDARWVLAVDLAAAWVLGSLAVSGKGFGGLCAPFARLADSPELVPGAPPGAARTLRGTALGAVILLPFGALFWTGDAAFAALSQQLPHPSPDSLPGRVLTFGLVLAAALGLALAARRPLAPALPRFPRLLTVREWAIPLVLLNALFASFVVVQFAVLFGGQEHVLRTARLTYAEYARHGFWQLLGASALTLGVVAGASVVTQVPRPRDRLLRQALLALLCGLTLVVIASAIRRLELYEDAFGLTWLRLTAVVFALWLAGLFAVLLVAGALVQARRVLGPVLVVGSAASLLGFTLANPDGLIAGRNVERWRETGRIDLGYLQGLSTDAAPALSTLPEGLRLAVLAPLRERLTEDDPWSSFNLARERARDLVASEVLRR
jgi:hypothetical protein